MTHVAYPAPAGLTRPSAVVLRHPRARHPSGLGFFDAIGAIAGGLIGSSTEKKRIRAERRIAERQIQAQLDAQREVVQGQIAVASLNNQAGLEVARINAGSQDRGYQAQERIATLTAKAAEAASRLDYLAARESTKGQVAVARARYAGETEIARQQRLAVEESEANALYAGATQGIIGAASGAVAETGNTLRSIPSSTNRAILGIVLFAGLAVALPAMGRKGKGKRGGKGSRGGPGRRAFRPKREAA